MFGDLCVQQWEPVITEKSHGQRSLAAIVHGDAQSQTRLRIHMHAFTPWGLIWPSGHQSAMSGNGNPLQYSCLVNSMAEEPGSYSPWGRKEDMTERLTLHSLRLDDF